MPPQDTGAVPDRPQACLALCFPHASPTARFCTSSLVRTGSPAGPAVKAGRGLGPGSAAT